MPLGERGGAGAGAPAGAAAAEPRAADEDAACLLRGQRADAGGRAGVLHQPGGAQPGGQPHHPGVKKSRTPTFLSVTKGGSTYVGRVP
eukprot:5641960-Pyramimonas_sp.AAC.2